MSAARNGARVAGRRPLLVAVVAAAALLALVPAAASAHPLGNFTINHFAGIRVGPAGIALDVVIDRAEIPTFSERQRIDTDGDGQVSATELEAERQAACGRLAPSLDLTVDGARPSLALAAAGVSFPPGAGGLSTMRVVCEFAATYAASPATGTSVAFADTSDEGRIGWREIVAVGDGMTIAGSPAAASGVSDRLTHYPADLLAVPLAITSASFTASSGGPALPAPCIPDACPLSNAPTDATPGFGCPATTTAASGSSAATVAGIGSAGSAGSAGSPGSTRPCLDGRRRARRRRGRRRRPPPDARPDPADPAVLDPHRDGPRSGARHHARPRQDDHGGLSCGDPGHTAARRWRSG